MGEIRVTPPEWVTQRAGWSTKATEGTYRADVNRQGSAGEPGRTAWSWALGFAPSDGVGFYYQGPGDITATDDKGPAEILATLASFVSAWEESLPDGENSNLFPRGSCEAFLGASEEFYADTHQDELMDE